MTDPPIDDDQRDAARSAAIEPIEIQEEMERSFLDYAMSVIIARALPDVRDGLKPVHRRILWGMYDLGRPPRPAAHEVRPRHRRRHGQVPPARRRRDLRRPRAHGPGLLAAPPADRRPRQLRLARLRSRGRRATPSAACRRWPCACSTASTRTPSTSSTTTPATTSEPVVLPARFPNLLVNGSQGIAVGMATNIPPHNLGEVIDATVHLIDHPEATPDDLMQFVKGPDFPTGGLIMGRAGHHRRLPHRPRLDQDAGRGRDRGGAQARRRPDRRHRDAVPESSLDADRRQDQGAGRQPASSRASPTSTTSRRRRQDPPRDQAQARRASANVILNNLYKHTPLQTNFAVNMVALVDGVPRTLNLVQALAAYVDHQVEVITPALASSACDKAQDRAHIVEGLLKALDMIDADHRRSSGRRTTAPRPATALHGRAVRVHRGAGRAHPRHARSASSPAWPRSTSRRRWPSCARPSPSSRRSSADEAQAAHGHQGRAGRDPRQVRHAERRSQITFDTGDIDIEDLIDDEELVVTHVAKRLHQDRRRRRVPHAGPRRPRRGRRQAPRRGLRHPRSSTPRPTPTCCSSPTAAGSTGSRRTRSR